jgi:hypothetical protein
MIYTIVEKLIYNQNIVQKLLSLSLSFLNIKFELKLIPTLEF